MFDVGHMKKLSLWHLKKLLVFLNVCLCGVDFEAMRAGSCQICFLFGLASALMKYVFDASFLIALVRVRQFVVCKIGLPELQAQSIVSVKLTL
jgi:hypothetical protein